MAENEQTRASLKAKEKEKQLQSKEREVAELRQQLRRLLKPEACNNGHPDNYINK